MTNEMQRSHPITQALTAVVRGICSRPRELEVREIENGNYLEIDFQPHESDIRVLIGKGFRQKNALTLLAAAMGRRMDTTTEISVTNSGRGDKEDKSAQGTNGSLSKERLIELLRPVVSLALGESTEWKVFEDDDKLAVEIYTSEIDAPTVEAIASLFHSVGRAHGGTVIVSYRHANKVNAPRVK